MKLFTCARLYALDANTNSLSIFHILEQIQSASFPAAVAFTVIATLEREHNEPTNPALNMQVLLDSVELANTPVNGDFQGQLRNRVIVEVGGVVIPKPGRLVVKLWWDKTTFLGEWAIDVAALTTAPSIAQVAAPSAGTAATPAPGTQS